MYKADISMKAGRGGDGTISFWHEKFIPLGGPDGGDGGKGGDIYITSDENMTDLSPFRHQTAFKADVGKKGGNQKKHGSSGEDLIVTVPVGTLVYKKGDDDILTLLADMDRHEKRVLVARGGNGGFGNVHFMSPTHRAPRRANSGEQGEEVKLTLEYRIPADVCIIGMPNSGKSTLLSSISGVKTRIAEYPFTTPEPVMGHVESGKKGFTIAEIPALIKGSHQGKGLGNSFLNHLERSKVLVYLLDGSSEYPAGDFQVLREELEAYDPGFLKKPAVVVINKVDLPDVEEKLKDIKNIFTHAAATYPISAQTGKGLQELIDGLDRLLAKEKLERPPEPAPEVVFRPKPIAKKK
jgi:GTPase